MTSRRDRRFLIIDDDELFCDAVAAEFGLTMSVHVAHTGESGVKLCRQIPMGVVLLDQRLSDGSGVDFCADILEANRQTKIVFATAYPTFDNAVDAVKFGAYDYLSKPLNMDELKIAVERAFHTLDLEQMEQVHRFENRRRIDKIKIVGDMQHTRRLIDLAAQNLVPVLVTGETGVGKSLVAKLIHYKSRQKDQPFISANCAALPENLIEAELFGAEKGAYTGSVARKKGIFEMAANGTLFLDEIGEVPIHLQSKLLGVLDEKMIRRLGGQSPIPVNARIVAATNRDLENALLEKRFRKDLYYRLSVLRIHVPPLREHLCDIPELCRFFLEQIAPQSKLELPSEEIRRLQNYHWPGNVREFRNVLERAAILGTNGRLHPSRLLETDERSDFAPSTIPSSCPSDDKNVVAGKDHFPTLEEIEKNHIRHALRVFDNNNTQCAKALGISRSTLKRKLKSL